MMPYENSRITNSPNNITYKAKRNDEVTMPRDKSSQQTSELTKQNGDWKWQQIGRQSHQITK